MDAVKNDVKRLVKIELAAANKKFRMFAGPHEGAGIIQEEVVEAVQEMNGLRQELNAMWMNVYSNNPQISTKGVYDRAVALAVEAIQTAAMARKFERSQRRNWPGAKSRNSKRCGRSTSISRRRMRCVSRRLKPRPTTTSRRSNIF